MFYISGNTEPKNSTEFIQALEGGIRELIAFPADAKIVSVTGEHPAFDSVAIDLGGGRIDSAKHLNKPTLGTVGQKGVSAKTLTIFAKPLRVDAGQVTVELSATQVSLNYHSDASGRLMLVPASSEKGILKLEISRADLETLILARATIAAAQQGAKITGLELKLTPRGERSLAIEVRVHAKKMMMAGVVCISGHVDIDDRLTARLSQMSCEGEGVAGKIAAGFLTPKIKQVDGRSFPLADESLNGLRLRDLRITRVDPVQVVAAFGT